MIDWFDLLVVQWTLKSLLKNHSLKHQCGYYYPQIITFLGDGLLRDPGVGPGQTAVSVFRVLVFGVAVIDFIAHDVRVFYK